MTSSSLVGKYRIDFGGAELKVVVAYVEGLEDGSDVWLNLMASLQGARPVEASVGESGVHGLHECHPHPCVVHNRTDHVLSSFPLRWDETRRVFLRICGHGVSHPDPDQRSYWSRSGLLWKAVHSCDGCCSRDAPGKSV